MKDIYPHANTKVCIEESKLLKNSQYELLHSAPGIQAAISRLNEMNYFSTHTNAEPDNYKDMLDGLMKGTFSLMAELSPNGLINRMFALFYDIHNMKLVVKEKFFGKRFDELALDYGSYPLRTIRSAAVSAEDNILENAVLTEGFFEALEATDKRDIDFILDRTYFKTLRKLAEDLGRPGILEFVAERIDLYNISAFLQSFAIGTPEGYFQKAFSECGTEPLEEWEAFIDRENFQQIYGFSLWRKYKPVWEEAKSTEQLLTELDIYIDNYLIGKTKACKLMAFGLEPICAYFYNKFIEIKNIRILLAGKENGYRTQDIRRRMRIAYEL